MSNSGLLMSNRMCNVCYLIQGPICFQLSKLNIIMSAKFSNWVGVSLCTYKCHICDSGFPSALMFFTGSWVWLDCGHFSWIFSSSHFLYTKLIPNYVLYLRNQEILCLLLSTSKIKVYSIFLPLFQ